MGHATVCLEISRPGQLRYAELRLSRRRRPLMAAMPVMQDSPHILDQQGYGQEYLECDIARGDIH